MMHILKKHMPMISLDVKRRIVEEYKTGKSAKQIKDELDIQKHERTIQRMLHDLGITRKSKESFNLAIKNGRVSWDNLKKQKRAKTFRIDIGDKKRFEVLKRDHFRCVYCGASTTEGVSLQLDHIVRPEDGGTNDIANLTTSCGSCNLGRYFYEKDQIINYKTEAK